MSNNDTCAVQRILHSNCQNSIVRVYISFLRRQYILQNYIIDKIQIAQ